MYLHPKELLPVLLIISYIVVGAQEGRDAGYQFIRILGINQWTYITTGYGSSIPSAKFGCTAVTYVDSMYVWVGTPTPSPDIWSFNFGNIFSSLVFNCN